MLGSGRDRLGAVISGATVIVTNTGTNVSNQVVSGDSGAFEVPYLTPGTYTLSVDAKGFKKFLRQGIVVNAGSRASIDVSVEVAVITGSEVVAAGWPRSC